MDGGVLIDGLALLVRELALFAAVGFLVLGTSDLLVDFIWIGLKLKRFALRIRPASLDSLPPPEAPGRLAIFVPTWREEAVIGPMLTRALDVWGGADVRIFVGCYPNDPATIAAVEAVADARVRLVVGAQEGPTTKADNLNTLWRALRAAEADGEIYKAIVLHDAEDVVHSAELALFDRMIERFDLVQLPVLPLPDPSSRLAAGSYLDEFAESHGKEMVVREALGAGLPSAGVGCAVSREALGLLGGDGEGPFDAASVTEDYEMGLKLHARGRRAAFVRLPAGERGGVVVLVTPLLATLMMIGTCLLIWRLVMRFSFVAASYGFVEGLRSVPRVIVSNLIAIMAAREALARYARARRTGAMEWGKTAHVFPDQVPAE